MEKTIFLTEDIEVLVASAGGVSTTFLIKAIEQYKKINCPNNTDGYKYLPFPPLGGRNDLKVLYIYGDPVIATLSLFRRQYHHTQSHCTQKFEKKKDIIPMDLTVEHYAAGGLDRLHLADHFHNWHSRYTQYNTLFIRYEDIHTNIQAIADYLNLPDTFVSTFPPAKQRKSSTGNISDTTLSQLELMYSELKHFQASLSGTSFVPAANAVKKLKMNVSSNYRRAYRHYLKRCKS